MSDVPPRLQRSHGHRDEAGFLALRAGTGGGGAIRELRTQSVPARRQGVRRDATPPGRRRTRPRRRRAGEAHEPRRPCEDAPGTRPRRRGLGAHGGHDHQGAPLLQRRQPLRGVRRYGERPRPTRQATGGLALHRGGRRHRRDLLRTRRRTDPPREGHLRLPPLQKRQTRRSEGNLSAPRHRRQPPLRPRSPLHRRLTARHAPVRTDRRTD
mmetsp:Transcript_27541/g.88981  ORF Transcript_27541/g.88981 Transcript_27541/m.88981 type:complete len:211 (+) Transcript_27541:359-991(+)